MDYQDLNFFSYYEKTNKKLSTSKEDGKFKENFVNLFENQKISDVKKMMMLTEEEAFKFDFIFQNKEYVDANFFKDIQLFDVNQEDEIKLRHFMDFLKRNYGVITPKTFKKAFEFCTKFYKKSFRSEKSAF